MFGEKLKYLRKEKGISQEELSEILDVSRQSISKYENGISQPSFEKLVLIAKFFNVSIDELLGVEEINNQEESLIINNSGNDRILIRSQIDNKVSSFYKFILSPVISKKTYHPQIMLLGVDGHSFWGDNCIPLAWYASKEEAERELTDILSAISKNDSSYELQYFSKVIKKGLLDIEMISE